MVPSVQILGLSCQYSTEISWSELVKKAQEDFSNGFKDSVGKDIYNCPKRNFTRIKGSLPSVKSSSKKDLQDAHPFLEPKQLAGLESALKMEFILARHCSSRGRKFGIWRSAIYIPKVGRKLPWHSVARCLYTASEQRETTHDSIDSLPLCTSRHYQAIAWVLF